MVKKRIKWDIEKVRKLFGDGGCELLEKEYINSSTKMKYICECGRPAEIILSSFLQGKRCKGCVGERASIRQRRTIGEIREIFRKGGCKLLETVYINARTKMKYICSCGRKAKIILDHFQRGVRCRGCMGERLAEINRKTIEEVKKIFEDEGCRLLDTVYKNNKTKMWIICNCGRKTKISLIHFRDGKRCKYCGIRKISGKNHYRYNFNLTEKDREDKRKNHKNIEWREKVFEKDSFTCQICGKVGGQICAHHLEGYNFNKKLRFVVSNGITLDENCHKSFHKIYGYGNNTREQFLEFKQSQKVRGIN